MIGLLAVAKWKVRSVATATEGAIAETSSVQLMGDTMARFTLKESNERYLLFSPFRILIIVFFDTIFSQLCENVDFFALVPEKCQTWVRCNRAKHRFLFHLFEVETAEPSSISSMGKTTACY